MLYIYRSNTTEEELGEMTKTTNPDEINIDEDYSSDEDEEIEGKIISITLYYMFLLVVYWCLVFLRY